MSITDEFTRLQTLHDNGTLSDAEFTAAKAKVLVAEAPTSSDGALQKEVQQLKIQNAIIQLDQDWETESQEYMLRGKYGSRSVPTQRGNINGMVMMGVLSLFLIIVGASVPKGETLVALGLIGIAMSIGLGIWGYYKTIAYDQAEERYRQKRNELSDQLGP